MTDNKILYQIQVLIDGFWEVKHETTDKIEAYTRLNEWFEVGFEVFLNEVAFPEKLIIER
jgi:hypothetical protein